MSRFAALGLLVASVASADPYDFRLYKLGNPQTGGTNFRAAANANFRTFARQMAAAMSAATLMPAESLGHAGFAFSAEISVVQLNEDATGAGGVTLPTQQAVACDSAENCAASGYKRGMGGWVLLPGVHIRKGLPYSFELGARMSWVEKSRMFVGDVELKWALNEGFTYLPDISIGVRVSKLINSRDCDITTGALEVMVGKQFALAGMLTLTPYAGWNLAGVAASSNPIDFNPQRSLGEAELPSKQFEDIYVFDSLPFLQNTHNRFFGGVRFISSPFMLGGEFSYTIIGSFKDSAAVEHKVPAVLAFNGMIGVDL